MFRKTLRKNWFFQTDESIFGDEDLWQILCEQFLGIRNLSTLLIIFSVLCNRRDLNRIPFFPTVCKKKPESVNQLHFEC